MHTVKKVLLGVAVVIIFAAYALAQRHHGDSSATATKTPATSGTTGGGQTTGNSGSSTASSGSSATYKDGTYTGAVANAFYGNVQVSATISGGRITAVSFLQAPHDNDNSVTINQQAKPALQQEALQAQSAHVDVVSGATQTSDAFVQSLSSALRQATQG